MARVNSRGVFNISRVLPNGSMAEKTSFWKHGFDFVRQHYLEFDLLAVLGECIKHCKDQTARNYCQGCGKIVNPHVDRLRQWYTCNIEAEIDAHTLKCKAFSSDLFLK